MMCPESCTGGVCTRFLSCQGLAAGAGDSCGPTGGDGGADGGTNDCCSSLNVPGGSFFRSFDMVNPSDLSKNFPANVSGFRLDAYEITVGRFRAFVAKTIGGWLPAAGSGKHVHLNAGSGLANGAVAATFETGWDTTWNPNLATTQAGWNTNLACDATRATWTANPGAQENRPVNCITWYEAYAFCIWDGGFLPSEAEWNYAASGGSEQRVYPWSAPATSTTIDCSYANYTPTTSGCFATFTDNVGTLSPKGDGKWGQSDLSGNVWEWNLDFYSGYVGTVSGTVVTCTDCANLSSSSSRVTRGGSFNLVAAAVLSSYRGNNPPAMRDFSVGARCARSP
jgi:formylglycine-generating enzyme required for sulfatase activity